MKSRLTNHTKPFPLVLCIAFALFTLTLLAFALMNGGLDFRSRAATVTKYTCMPRGECTGRGTVVRRVYCGSSCLSPRQCCKTTTTIVPTPTPQCSPGAKKCNGSSWVHKCTAQGTWTSYMQCDLYSQCVNGACVRSPTKTPTPTKKTPPQI